MKTFKLHTANNQLFNEKTRVNGKLITNEIELCKFIRAHFLTVNKNKSFTDWANELNKTGYYEGKFTKYDALDTLSSSYVLNIDNKHVDIYKLFQTNSLI